jgi:hypothetical protein
MRRVSWVDMRKTLAVGAIAVGVLMGCTQKESSSERSVNIDLSKEKSSLQKTLSSAESNLKKGAREAQDKLQEAGDTIKRKAEEAKDKLTDEKKPNAAVTVEVKK